jgi:glycosyltransferase involved in cell wall biosynthesis
MTPPKNREQPVPDYPRISIVTPSFNSVRYIRRTIESVLNQRYPNFQYIVMDGGSKDGTVETVAEYGEAVRMVSEPDHGLYDAVHKGFLLADGEILSWLNSDDVLFPNSLENVARVFSGRPDIRWLTGVPAHIDESDRLVNVERPKVYFRRFICYGLYNGACLGYIQQESTFFRRSLYEQEPVDAELQLAGDFDLWRRFARHAKLYTAKTILAAFRIREGQLSVVHREDYERECRRLCWAPRSRFLRALIMPFAVLMEGDRMVRLDRGISSRLPPEKGCGSE